MSESRDDPWSIPDVLRPRFDTDGKSGQFTDAVLEPGEGGGRDGGGFPRLSLFRGNSRRRDDKNWRAVRYSIFELDFVGGTESGFASIDRLSIEA